MSGTNTNNQSCNFEQPSQQPSAGGMQFNTATNQAPYQMNQNQGFQSPNFFGNTSNSGFQAPTQGFGQMDVQQNQNGIFGQPQQQANFANMPSSFNSPTPSYPTNNMNNQNSAFGFNQPQFSTPVNNQPFVYQATENISFDFGPTANTFGAGAPDNNNNFSFGATGAAPTFNGMNTPTAENGGLFWWKCPTDSSI